MADQTETYTDLEAGDERPAPGADLGRVAPGVQVDRYVIADEIGEGGMGSVYLADDPALERKVALKFLREGAWAVSERRLARFEREAKVMARLSHPNVVAVHDVGTYFGRLFLAMSYVEGGTLHTWLQGERTWRDVWRVMRAAGEGLAAAHDAGIVHRDFKPDNVLMRPDGTPLVTDFGIAKAFDVEDDDRPRGGGDGDGEPTPERTVSGTDIAIGTPRYMAPEQHLRGDVGPWSDQFAFAVVLWQSLFGQHPFEGDTVAEVADAIVRGARRPLEDERGVPRWFRQALDRALSADPADRYDSLPDLLAELSRDPVRRRRLVAGASLALVAAVAGGASIGLFAGGDGGPTCSDGADTWQGVWDDEARAGLMAAFEASKAPYAVHRGADLANALDDYVGRWKLARLSVCRATNATASQSRAMLDYRMRCLDQIRADVGAIARRYATRLPDEAVAAAARATRILPELTSCTQPGNLEAEKALPADTELRGEIQRVDDQLGEAKAALAAGAFSDALVRSNGLVAPAQATGYGPVQARVYGNLGRVYNAMNQFDKAEQALMTSIRLASAAGDGVEELRSWISMMAIVGHGQEDEARGRLLVDMAEAAFHRIDASDDLAARYHLSFGTTLLALSDAARAEVNHRKALALVQELYGEESERMATALQNLGASLRAQGKTAEGDTLVERSLNIRERVQGRDHPDFAYALVAFADVLRARGEHKRALKLLREALLLREAAFGASNPLVVWVLDAIAWSAASIGSFDEAIAAAERAVRIRSDVFGPDDTPTIDAQETLAVVLAMAGRYAEAEPHFERALQRSLARLGPEHPEALADATNLGLLQLLAGKHKVAAETCAGVLPLMEGKATATPFRPGAASCAGRASVEMGRYRQARSHLLNAERWYSAMTVDPKDLAEVRFALAKAHLALGAKAKARAAAKAALGDYERAEGVEPQTVQAVRDWLDGHQ